MKVFTPYDKYEMTLAVAAIVWASDFELFEDKSEVLTKDVPVTKEVKAA